MKDLPYITHDLGARNDPKLLSLQMKMGGQGLAIYWCLVEMLWEQGGYLPTDYESIAFALRWASAEDVQKVVEGFELFKWSDGQFWSESALARIGFKKAKSDQGKNAARMRWQKDSNADAMLTQCVGNADAMPIINKVINKEKKESNNNIINMPPTAADLFEIFFLELNFTDPAGEVERFIEYYTERGWCYQDGTGITDFDRVARDWKPLKPGKKVDAEALRWYRSVYQAAKNRKEGAPFLRVRTIRRKAQNIALVYANEDDARAVAGFIMDNDLAGDWKIDFRLENK